MIKPNDHPVAWGLCFTSWKMPANILRNAYRRWRNLPASMSTRCELALGTYSRVSTGHGTHAIANLRRAKRSAMLSGVSLR